MDVDASSLREKIEELKSLDASIVGARIQIVEQRAKLEEKAAALSNETDVDQDVVLMAIGASWAENIEGTFDARQSGDQFRKVVENDVRIVLYDLVGACVSLNSRQERVRDRLIAVGKTDHQPVRVRDVFVGANKMAASLRT